MKKPLVHLIAFSVAALFATAVTAQDDVFNKDFDMGGGGGGAACSMCYGSYNFNTGAGHMWCGSPEPGGWGNQYCQVESEGNSMVCSTAGSSCCVD
jgi:hypothetical protein